MWASIFVHVGWNVSWLQDETFNRASPKFPSCSPKRWISFFIEERAFLGRAVPYRCFEARCDSRYIRTLAAFHILAENRKTNSAGQVTGLGRDLLPYRGERSKNGRESLAAFRKRRVRIARAVETMIFIIPCTRFSRAKQRATTQISVAWANWRVFLRDGWFFPRTIFQVSPPAAWKFYSPAGNSSFAFCRVQPESRFRQATGRAAKRLSALVNFEGAKVGPRNDLAFALCPASFHMGEEYGEESPFLYFTSQRRQGFDRGCSALGRS